MKYIMLCSFVIVKTSGSSVYWISDPYPAHNLTSLVSTVSSLILTWDAPDVGGLTKYRVTLKGYNTVKTQTPDKDTTTVVFIGLTAGTEYTARLVTLNVDQQSAKVEDVVYTSKSADALFYHWRQSSYSTVTESQITPMRLSIIYGQYCCGCSWNSIRRKNLNNKSNRTTKYILRAVFKETGSISCEMYSYYKKPAGA
jgi:hypothetical protein